MNRTKILLGASGVVLAVVGAAPASASGTNSGTVITNTATVNYSVGGNAQTAQTASDSFTVDRKINLTVAEVGTTTTQVSPGQTAAVTSFTVRNDSNATLDFALVAAQQSGGAGAHANTDSFDATNVRIYVDAAGAGAGTYGPEDQLIGFIDELAADTSRTVFVVADIPLGQPTGAVAAVTLTATGREGGAASTTTPGAALVQTGTASTAGVDTVFADGAGATDGARNADFSAKDDYTVLAAALTVLKTSTIVSDPFNNASNPKLIPGAVVEYCVSVANAANGAAANNVVVSDPLPTTTTYDSTFGIRVGGTKPGATCLADGAPGGTFDTSAKVVSATINPLPAGDTRTVVFRVTVN